MAYRKGTAILAASAAATALVAVGGGVASGTPHAQSKLIATPKLVVTISKGLYHVKGPRHFSAGRVDVVLHAKKGEQEVGFARLHKGYTFAEAKKDYNAAQAQSPAALKALNRIVRHVTFYGGIDSGNGHTTVSGSVVLPKAGTYYVLDDENGPFTASPVKLHVSKRQGSRVTPKTSGLAKAITAKRWRGSPTLPADGTIKVKNASTNSPHFLALFQVKKGTTRKEVIKALNSSSQGPPPFALRHGGSTGTDALSPGISQTLTYSLPKGTYVEACFFPDLQTGIPHALMGMVRIVRLK
jgi:hypothetical protein